MASIEFRPLRLATLAIAGGMGASLAACSSRTGDAESQYNVVSNTGSLRQKCEKAREIEDAYLKAQDQQSYRRWKLKANTDCLTAEQEGGDLPANAKQRRRDEERAAKAVDQALNEEGLRPE